MEDGLLCVLDLNTIIQKWERKGWWRDNDPSLFVALLPLPLPLLLFLIGLLPPSPSSLCVKDVLPLPINPLADTPSLPSLFLTLGSNITLALIKVGQTSQLHVRSRPPSLAPTFVFPSVFLFLQLLRQSVSVFSCVILIIMEGLNNALSRAVLRMPNGCHRVA